MKNKDKTHCKRGHLFDGSNTYVSASGKRSCVVCVKEANKKRYLENVDAWRARHREWHSKNPERSKALKSEYRTKNPDANRKWRYRTLYGISIQDYESMLSAQGGCAICGASVPGGRGKIFHVDHDHATGRVRGLLCNRCNVNLGHYETWALKHLDRIKSYLVTP